MNKTPQTLKGFRDFLPEAKRSRDWLESKLKRVFEIYGFEPLQNPTLEYASLLLGKYGDEADKLVYTFKDKGNREVGLRYDQTVPLARTLSQYQHQLPQMFRRYQIQNVFRAEKPQKGRYREFTQCDLDITGSSDPVADAEILATTYAAYSAIGYPTIQLKINHRQGLLEFISQFTNNQQFSLSVIQSIDKLDKLSSQQVQQELTQKGLATSDANSLLKKIKQLKPTPQLNQIITAATSLGVPQSSLIFHPSLARGLDYYTGMIFEVTVPEFNSGSLGGGGRYDNLISDLGGPDLPAVGVGFGFDRMLEAAHQLQLIPTTTSTALIMVTYFDRSTIEDTLELTKSLRKNNLKTQLYPAPDKIGKQIRTANKKGIRFLIILGQEELGSGKLTLRDLKTSEQETITLNQAISKLVKFNK